ncbi:MAG: prolyl oligopeptidase family serine peptidase [Gammaproteobacteria bacterium]|nr:prolyl oligopeptidase family serine peptidase [Gammaproteobacteria bacterium]
MIRFCSGALLTITLLSACADQNSDPYLWLEDVESERSLDWVRKQNKETFAELKDHPLYQSLYEEAYSILTSEARIPEGEIVGDEFHNFWQDEAHVRGVWRSTSLESFVAGDPTWRTVLSFDELAEREDENWVYQGIDCLGDGSDRCLVEMSRGGKDESVYREFSLSEKQFVDNGFHVPEAKSFVAWADENSLLVATDWGEDSLTNSGYPREARLWDRGTPLGDSKFLYRADVDDTLLAPVVYHSADSEYPFLLLYYADWNDNAFIPIVDGNVLESLAIPLRLSLEGIIDGRAIISLEQDWSNGGADYESGDIVALDLEGGATELVFSPSHEQAVSDIGIGATSIYVEMLDNVIGRIKRLRRSDGGWHTDDVALPDNGVALLAATSSSRDDLFVTYESSIQPTTMYHVSAKNELTEVAALDPLYDASDVVINQAFATSSDGERVPYFLIGRMDVLKMGNAPTVLYGYGGFLNPILPVYYEDPSRPQHGALAGRMWISRGGVLALANLRGGGEYGPRWHQAALLENRQLAFDDYFAIAEHLIDTGVTSSDKLGALGRSNGGLLLGVALTQRPDLFAALDIGVPLLDMQRYSKLLAGASWMGEYGNPDVPEDWAFISKYSPYQNLDAGKDYPKVLFYTSTKDDRVHPGHARKMAAKLDDMGYDFYYYENIEGGHGGTANQEQLAMRTALEYAYFVSMLMPSSWERQATD